MLEVTERVPLPPGPVQVRVELSCEAKQSENTEAVLRRIWTQRESRAAAARTKAQIDAEIAAMRDEDEQRMREIEAIRR